MLFIIYLEGDSGDLLIDRGNFIAQGRIPETMSPLYVRSKVCMAPYHVQSKVCKFAPHMDGSNTDFAPHMEWSNADFAPQMEQKHSFRDQILKNFKCKFCQFKRDLFKTTMSKEFT